MKFKNTTPIWPERSTPEDLEMERGITKVIQYGDRVIAICHERLNNDYYFAVYVFSDEGRTCEDEVLLDCADASGAPDEGHAIENGIWACNH